MTFPRSPKSSNMQASDVELNSDPQRGSALTQKTLVGSSTQIHSYTQDVENSTDIASA